MVYSFLMEITWSAQEVGENAYIQKICKETLNCKGANDMPEAHWSRGAVTTTMMKFIQHFCTTNEERMRGNETYELIAAWMFRDPSESSNANGTI